MIMRYQVSLSIGSLRQKSFNRILAQAIAQLARRALPQQIVEFAEFAFL